MLQDIDLEIKGPYKSISALEWRAVPGFSVLTGLNGAGKTQLLELLAYGLNGATFLNGERPDATVVKGGTIDKGAVAYLRSNHNFEEAQHATVTSLRQVKINMLQNLLASSHDLKAATKRNRIERELGLDLSTISAEQFAEKLPDDMFHLFNDVDLVFELAHVFLNYKMQLARILLDGKSMAEATKDLGPSPWALINSDLTTAAFPYQFLPPSGEIYEPFQLKLQEIGSSGLIKPSDLSSGEKLILEMVLWLFISKKRTSFPQLFLMDEPDAHLHPQMTSQFLVVIEEVLVKKHGVRVIITTHSPSTVALAPESSLFEMRRGEAAITKCSRSSAISMLTAGLVTVSPGSKHVIVEDTDDIEFYATVRDVLSDFGARKDRLAIPSSPSILFLPASSGQGTNKTGGGCSVVYKWVEKFDDEPLRELFRGIVDKDVNNTNTDRVFTLSRYSIENYWIDPFNVYGLLLQTGAAPVSPGLKVGEEHLISTLDHSVLQTIVDTITSKVSTAETSLQAVSGQQDVEFTNGITLKYPNWMITHRGKDLLQMFQTAWGGPGIVKPPSLLFAFRRVRMVPVDLAVLLRRVQE